MNKECYDFTGKVAVVTGGSRGIGLKMAGKLLGLGARVAICGRKQEGLDAALAELNAGDNLIAVKAHVAREEDVDRLFNATLERFGRLDILVNNVGMNLFTPSVIESGTDLWQKIIESNLTGAYLCARQAGRIMREQKAGKIVSISSLAARQAAPGMGIYGIAKAGVEMLTKVLAVELASSGVQVNAVAPGMVKTDFSRPFWGNEQMYSQIVNTIPLGRIAEPEDVVGAVLYLCSGAADFVTGQVMVIDGGATAV